MQKLNRTMLGFAAIVKLISLDLGQAFCHVIKTVGFSFSQLTSIQRLLSWLLSANK
jgi:hypothetical protein